MTYDGRRAWRLTVPVEPNQIAPDVSADRLSITVDRETGVPVRVVATRRGEPRSEVRLEGLRVDAPVDPGELRIEFPPGVDVRREDLGFRRVPLARVRSIVRYAPLVPAWTAPGYEFAEVAVAERGGPTAPEGSNPLSEMVVSLAYRRGFDEFLVTTRLARPRDALAPEEGGPSLEQLWDDPLATGRASRTIPSGSRSRPARSRVSTPNS